MANSGDSSTPRPPVKSVTAAVSISSNAVMDISQTNSSMAERKPRMNSRHQVRQSKGRSTPVRCASTCSLAQAITGPRNTMTMYLRSFIFSHHRATKTMARTSTRPPACIAVQNAWRPLSSSVFSGGQVASYQAPMASIAH